MLSTENFETYIKYFVQRMPRYGIKQINGIRWSTKHKALSNRPILAHLEGQYYVGVLGQWYPSFAVLDIDNQPIERIDEIRGSLDLNENNSMLFESESKDSYHLIIRPHFNNKPPTIRRLKDSFKIFTIQNNIEIYPQSNRFIRIPFGLHQNPIDFSYFCLNNWQEYLYWFNKLDEFNLSVVEGQQLGLDLQIVSPGTMPNKLQEGKELLEYGLQMSSSRHESQFKILYYLWRNNIPQEQAETMTWNWIRTKHNGFSRDITRYPGQVRKEISRQVAHIYGKYELSCIYPDSTHNLHHGYITEPDIQEIIQICHASMPRIRFLFNIVKYSYPRRFRDFIGVHTDKLIKWGSINAYMKYLDEFKNIGLVERGKSYSTGRFLKSLKLNWKYHNSDNSIMYERRSIDTFEDTAKLVYSPSDLRGILSKAGSDKAYIRRIIKAIYGGEQKKKHI